MASRHFLALSCAQINGLNFRLKLEKAELQIYAHVFDRHHMPLQLWPILVGDP